ncbi:uncharacterized protein LOC142342189 isoform X2 [Convolutriloba macropyga]|uniref:uncharacterized protein LOC142342189 isoform X2 n=1 Tax=Convolutriloba macropyga TaxID=536237 RepID=UPI003F5279E9
MFFCIKLALLVIFTTIGIVLNDQRRKQLYFRAKHRKICLLQFKDAVFHFRNPIWVKKFDREFSDNFYSSKEAEFESLLENFPCPTREIAILRVNRGKNRYPYKYLPFDHTLLELDHVDKFHSKSMGYANASYIPGPSNEYAKEYIMIQDPMKSTVNDFLHVIFDKNIRLVVRVTTDSEEIALLTSQDSPRKDPKASFKYYPDFTDEEGFIDVEDFHVLGKSWEEVAPNCREMILKKRDNVAVRRLVLQLNVFLTTLETKNVTLESIDYILDQVLTLDKLVKENYLRDRSVTKFLIHCKTGIKLSGFFVVLYRVIKEAERKRFVDIKGCVADVRWSRNLRIVDSSFQYRLLYLTVYRHLERRHMISSIQTDSLIRSIFYLRPEISVISEMSILTTNMSATDVSSDEYPYSDTTSLQLTPDDESQWFLSTDQAKLSEEEKNELMINNQMREAGVQMTLSVERIPDTARTIKSSISQPSSGTAFVLSDRTSTSRERAITPTPTTSHISETSIETSNTLNNRRHSSPADTSSETVDEQVIPSSGRQYKVNWGQESFIIHTSKAPTRTASIFGGPDSNKDSVSSKASSHGSTHKVKTIFRDQSPFVPDPKIPLKLQNISSQPTFTKEVIVESTQGSSERSKLPSQLGTNSRLYRSDKRTILSGKTDELISRAPEFLQRLNLGQSSNSGQVQRRNLASAFQNRDGTRKDGVVIKKNFVHTSGMFKPENFMLPSDYYKK